MPSNKNYYVIYLCAAIGPLAGNAILAMLPELQANFNSSLDDVLLSIPAFMFPFAFFQLFSGSLSDKWGRKRTLLLGLIIYALSSAGIALMDNLVAFLLLRIGQGLGNAFISPVALAMLGDLSDARRYGVAIGFYGSFTTAGIAVGPLVGGFLAEIDWRLAFALFAALAMLSFLLVLVMISYPGSDTRSPATSISKNIREAISHRNIALISIIGAVSFFAIIGSISFLSDHLRTDNALLFTAADVGMIISIGGFIGIFFSPIAGRFIDVCSPRLAALVGMSITIPSVVLTAFVQDFYLFLTLSAFNGIGGAFLWTGLLTTAVAEIPRMRGTTSSIFNSSRFSGYAISPILLGPVYSHFNYIGIALTCGALLIIASLLAYILPRKKCKELSEQPSVPAGDQRR